MLRKLVILAAVALINSSSAIAAAGGCHDLSGTYVQQFVPCVVPGGIACVDATLTGDLEGVSHTVITSFDPITGAFTGDVTIVRANGSTLTSTIEGVGGSDLGFETITGGNRQYVGATGTIVATGTSVGTYAGEVCLRGDDKS